MATFTRSVGTSDDKARVAGHPAGSRQLVDRRWRSSRGAGGRNHADRAGRNRASGPVAGSA